MWRMNTKTHKSLSCRIHCMVAGTVLLVAPATFAQSSATPTQEQNRPTAASGSAARPSADRVNTSSDRLNSPDAQRANPAGALEKADRRFLNKAAKSGYKEVQLSKFASDRATKPEVKQLAQQMVRDHEAVNTELMSIASRKGLTMDQIMGDKAMHHATRGTSETRAKTAAGNATTSSTRMDQSSSMAAVDSSELPRFARNAGNDFDRNYVEHLVNSHERSVELYEDAAEDASDPDIQAFARATLPKLQQHHATVERLNRELQQAAN